MDVIAFSKTKQYKIIMLSLFGIGVILAAIGLVLMGMQTRTVPPNALLVEFSGAQQTVNPNTYEVTITKDFTIIVDTGTGKDFLTTPITFTMNAECAMILEPIADMRQMGYVNIKIKATAPNNTTGTLDINCGSFTKTYFLTTYLE